MFSQRYHNKDMYTYIVFYGFYILSWNLWADTYIICFLVVDSMAYNYIYIIITRDLFGIMVMYDLLDKNL